MTIALALVAALAAADGSPESLVQGAPAGVSLAAAVANLSQTAAPLAPIRLEDGEMTLNDRCPVTLKHLSRGIQALYVNGRPIGFC